MIIGINAAAAVKKQRTGVEEYTYQLIKYLTMLPETREHRFLLYLPSAQHNANIRMDTNDANEKNFPNFFEFLLPENFEIKILRWPLPILWTQIRLAWEMLFHQPDALFIPAHILPLAAPKNSVVTIHGLEYEYFPAYYPVLFRWYLRWSTKRAIKKARQIIAVSENTKRDLVRLYGCEAEKIEVVRHGIDDKIFNFQFSIFNQIPNSKFQISKPYLLYLGRLETKKNIQGILAAYKILKEKYNVPHELVLAGAPGFGYEKIKKEILKLQNRSFCHSVLGTESTIPLIYKDVDSRLRGNDNSKNIIEIGYVSEDKKYQLLSSADLFLFPSFYEGFGLPILEAQVAGAPVVTSYNSSLPEVAGEGAVFVNPKNSAQIAEAVHKILEDRQFRDKIVAAGHENVKKFDWEKCARETLKILLEK